MEAEITNANAENKVNEAAETEQASTVAVETEQSGSDYEMVAKTFQGLEEVLAKELTEIGAKDIKTGRRMVSFRGDKEMMYRANFALRTAVRILKPIKHFNAQTADQVYDAIKAIEWTDYLSNETSFAVDSVVFSEDFRHSKFVAYKVKDAIVDYFREKTGKRPNISVTNPDLRLNIHISDEDCTLSLDSSGDSLHHRGYRQESVEAPINEVLAAGLIKLTGWDGECDFIDPMCGSGTFPIEAALIARNIAPGVFRKEYAFEKWSDFDSELFDRIYNDESHEREFTHKIYGYDNNQQAIAIANANVKAAGVSKDVEIKFQPFQQFMQPTEKSLMMMNPPYGERISSPDILGLYRTIGERLKHQFVDNDAWIISHREELFDEIGLKPSLKIPIYNGSLECEFRKYQIFSGRYNDLRSDGGQIKSEDELKQMGEKHRFKEHREDFKRRFSDDDEEDVPTGHFRVRGVRDDDDRRGGRRFDRDKESRFGGRDRDRESRFGGRDRDKDSRFGGRDRDKDSRFGGRDRDKDSHFGGRDRDKDSHFGGFNHDRDNHFGGRDRDRDRDNEHRAPRHFDHSDDRGGRSFSSGRKPFGGGGRRDSGFKPRGGDYNRRRDNNNEDED